MEPDLGTVLRWRAMARGWARLAGVMSLPPGVFFLAAWLVEGTYDGDLMNFRYYYWRVLSGGLFCSWGVIGVAFPGVLARLAFPLPRAAWPPRCPYCRHELVSLRGARCPECGNGLTEEFVERSARAPEGGS